MDIDGVGLSTLGYSFGGAAALELARMDPAVSRAAVWWGALGVPGLTVNGLSRTSLLLLQGARDPWAPPALLDRIEKELAGERLRHKLVRYADGYHAFGIPEVGDRSEHGLKYDASIAADAWQRTLTFLRDP